MYNLALSKVKEACQSLSGIQKIHLFDAVASTNETLWQLLEAGEAPGTVVIATQQTAGRGQWGRKWQSDAGGLYLSWAIAPNLPVARSAQLTLCSAWGIAKGLRDRDVPAAIKWPNDLLLTGRKLGGILTETRVQRGQITRAVIGAGINWANPVPDTGINLQSFLANQPLPAVSSLEALAGIVLEGLVAGYNQLQAGGIDSLLPSYLELLSCMGHPVYLQGCQGVVAGITADNELRVQVSPGMAANLLNSEIRLKPGTISLGYGKQEGE